MNRMRIETSLSARATFQRGDRVVIRAAYQAGICEVIRIEAGGLVRLRGLHWPSGYSALAIAANLQLVSAGSASGSEPA